MFKGQKNWRRTFFTPSRKSQRSATNFRKKIYIFFISFIDREIKLIIFYNSLKRRPEIKEFERTHGSGKSAKDGAAVTNSNPYHERQYYEHCKSDLATGSKRNHCHVVGQHSRLDFGTVAGCTEMLQRGRCSRGTRHARAPGTTLHAKKGRRVSQRFSADNRPLPGCRAPETRSYHGAHCAHHVRERSGFDRGRDEQCLNVRK